MLLILFVLAFIGGLLSDNLRNKFSLDDFGSLVLLSIFEELFYRQILFWFIKDFYYIFISSTVFGLMHVFNFTFNKSCKLISYQVFSTTILGYVLAENYFMYENLGYVIGVHVLYNFIVVGVAFQKSGNNINVDVRKVYIFTRRNSVDTRNQGELKTIISKALIKEYHERTEKLGDPYKYLE